MSHVNSSYMTSVANDYSFDEVYARLVKAKMRMGDVLIGISTSGNSMNIIKAMDMARVQGAITVAMTGLTGGKLASNCDFLLNIPSSHTPRIQEAHITVGHIICELVEKRIFTTQVSRALMVGDSASDIEFGQALGMKTVLMQGKEEETDLLNTLNPDFIFQKFSKIVDLL